MSSPNGPHMFSRHSDGRKVSTAWVQVYLGDGCGVSVKIFMGPAGTGPEMLPLPGIDRRGQQWGHGAMSPRTGENHELRVPSRSIRKWLWSIEICPLCGILCRPAFRAIWGASSLVFWRRLLHAAGTVPVGKSLFTNSRPRRPDRTGPFGACSCRRRATNSGSPLGDLPGTGVAHYAASGPAHEGLLFTPTTAISRGSKRLLHRAFYTFPDGLYHGLPPGETSPAGRSSTMLETRRTTRSTARRNQPWVRIGTCASRRKRHERYYTGNNKLIRAIGSKYSLIYCAGNSSCTLSSTTSSAASSTAMTGPNSGTPLVYSLNEARLPQRR